VLAPAALSSLAMAAPNHYELLGLEQGASEEEVKAAFRRKAKELHPDVNSEVGAYSSRSIGQLRSAAWGACRGRNTAGQLSRRDVLLTQDSSQVYHSHLPVLLWALAALVQTHSSCSYKAPPLCYVCGSGAGADRLSGKTL
jgi:hypothetical protein